MGFPPRPKLQSKHIKAGGSHPLSPQGDIPGAGWPWGSPDLRVPETSWTRVQVHPCSAQLSLGLRRLTRTVTFFQAGAYPSAKYYGDETLSHGDETLSHGDAARLPALGEGAAACCTYIAFQPPSFPRGAGLEQGKQPNSRGQPEKHLLLTTSERRIYLAVSHHDHPDQHDVDVNAQGLIVINLIHLKKGGK